MSQEYRRVPPVSVGFLDQVLTIRKVVVSAITRITHPSVLSLPRDDLCESGEMYFSLDRELEEESVPAWAGIDHTAK